MPAPLSAKLNFRRTLGFTTRRLNHPIGCTPWCPCRPKMRQCSESKVCGMLAPQPSIRAAVAQTRSRNADLSARQVGTRLRPEKCGVASPGLSLCSGRVRFVQSLPIGAAR